MPPARKTGFTVQTGSGGGGGGGGGGIRQQYQEHYFSLHNHLLQ
jgi:hypothetical protein